MNLVKIALLLVQSIVTYSFPIKFPPNLNFKKLIEFLVHEEQYFLDHVPKDDYPYFNWIPHYLVHIQAKKNKIEQDSIENQEQLDSIKKLEQQHKNDGVTNKYVVENYEFSSICYKKVKVTVEQENEKIHISVRPSDRGFLPCSDTIVFGSWEEFEILELSSEKEHKLTMKNSWDVQNKGLMIFDCEKPLLALIKNFFRTGQMFADHIYSKTPKWYLDLNIDFMQKYFEQPVIPRKQPFNFIPEEMIREGDTFHIAGLGSLNSLIQWAFGSATGHMTVVVKRHGVLQVCESTDKTFSGKIGIQCNPYNDWMHDKSHGGEGVVWAPIDRSITFDSEAANKFIDEYEGVQYGYINIIMGWIDQYKENYPCLRNDQNPRDRWGVCLEPQNMELLFTAVERLVPDLAIVWKQAMSKRVNEKNTTLPETYKKAHQMGIDSTMLPTIPEQDDWVYETTRYGKPVESRQMICHVFVCEVLRAGGIFKQKFGDIQFNCTEATLFDIYKLNIFEPDFERPQSCIERDPENPLCQINGDYVLRLDNFRKNRPNYNFVTPRNFSFEDCPGIAPNWFAEPDC